MKDISLIESASAMQRYESEVSNYSSMLENLQHQLHQNELKIQQADVLLNSNDERSNNYKTLISASTQQLAAHFLSHVVDENSFQQLTSEKHILSVQVENAESICVQLRFRLEEQEQTYITMHTSHNVVVQELTEQYNDITMKLQTSEQTATLLSSELEKLCEMSLNAQNEYQRAQQEHSKIIANIAVRNAEYLQLQATLAAMHAADDQRNVLVQQIQEQNLQSKATINELLNERNIMSDRLLNLQVCLDDVQRLFETSKLDEDRLKQQVEKLEGEIHAERNANIPLLEKFANFDENIKKLQEENVTLSNKFNDSVLQIENFKTSDASNKREYQICIDAIKIDKEQLATYALCIAQSDLLLKQSTRNCESHQVSLAELEATFTAFKESTGVSADAIRLVEEQADLKISELSINLASIKSTLDEKLLALANADLSSTALQEQCAALRQQNEDLVMKAENDLAVIEATFAAERIQLSESYQLSFAEISNNFLVLKQQQKEIFKHELRELKVTATNLQVKLVEETIQIDLHNRIFEAESNWALVQEDNNAQNVIIKDVTKQYNMECEKTHEFQTQNAHLHDELNQLGILHSTQTVLYSQMCENIANLQKLNAEIPGLKDELAQVREDFNCKNLILMESSERVKILQKQFMDQEVECYEKDALIEKLTEEKIQLENQLVLLLANCDDDKMKHAELTVILQNKLDFANEEIKLLEEKRTNLLEEKEKKYIKWIQTKNELISVNAALQNEQTQVIFLKSAVTEQDSKINLLEEKVAILQQEIDKQEKICTVLRTQLNDVKQFELGHNISQAQLSLLETEHENVAASQRIELATAEEHVAKFSAELVQNKKFLDDMIEKLYVQEKNNTTILAEKFDLRREYGQVCDKYETLQQAYASVQAELDLAHNNVNDRVEATLQAVQHEIESLLTANTSALSRVSSLESELAAKTVTLQTMSVSTQELSEKCLELEEDLLQMEASERKLTAVIVQLRDNESDLLREINEYEKNVATFAVSTEQTAIYQTKLQEIMAASEILRQEHQTLNKEYDLQAHDLSATKNLLAQAQSTLTKTEEYITELKKNLVEQSAEVASTRLLFSCLKSASAVLEDENVQLKHLLESRDDQEKVFRERITALELQVNISGVASSDVQLRAELDRVTNPLRTCTCYVYIVPRIFTVYMCLCVCYLLLNQLTK